MDSTRQIEQIKREPHRIPEELLSEILLRVPARSVVRFWYVCKQWRSITHDPHFIDAHLDLARKAASPSILFFLSDPSWDKYGITIMNHNSRPLKQILPGSKTYGVVDCCMGHVGNSCNGLLCIYSDSDDERIRLINPATAESLTLPEHTKTTAGSTIVAYLGFHPETKEYKVIRFFHSSYDFGPLGCEVHTLGSSSWRQIPCPEQCYAPCFSTTTTVEGAMYWLTRDQDAVVSFDLKGENFTQISLPDSIIYRGVTICRRLVGLQGSVCLTVTLIDDTKSTSQQIDLWTMTITIDDHNIIKYEWNQNYSVLLPISGKFRSTPLFVNEAKILVHTRYRGGYLRNWVDYDLEELVYYPLNGKGQREEVLYRERKSATPSIDSIHHPIKGHRKVDEAFFHKCGIYHSYTFVHIESLVPLQR